MGGWEKGPETTKSRFYQSLTFFPRKIKIVGSESGQLHSKEDRKQLKKNKEFVYESRQHLINYGENVTNGHLRTLVEFGADFIYIDTLANKGKVRRTEKFFKFWCVCSFNIVLSLNFIAVLKIFYWFYFYLSTCNSLWKINIMKWNKIRSALLQFPLL